MASKAFGRVQRASNLILKKGICPGDIPKKAENNLTSTNPVEH